jgi:hypothetical protein
MLDEQTARAEQAEARVATLESALAAATEAVTRNHARVEALEAMLRRLVDATAGHLSIDDDNDQWLERFRNLMAAYEDARALLDDTPPAQPREGR